MKFIVITFTILMAAIHIVIFIGESILWLQPTVHERLIAKMDISSQISLYEQAKILEVVFFNQGFYNLFIALGAVTGLLMLKSSKTTSGKTIISYSCLMAIGASAILAYSSTAYSGALVQGVPALIALLGLLLIPERHLTK